MIALPPRHQRELTRAECNRSLYFDSGFDGFEIAADGERSSVPAGIKAEFLARLSSLPTLDASAFLARRQAALSALGAKPTSLVTQSRLVVGLGLPSPLETGFLLDRLTGCPYLPGSSAKGLARATAALVARGELDGDAGFWSSQLERIFGPAIGLGREPMQGAVTFYDAFPMTWPGLEVDVLTPHFPDYYRNPDEPPADWQEPNPVAFLTVTAGTTFEFWLGPGGKRFADADLARTEAVLRQGLGALGIGAKTSAGYGWFGEAAPVPDQAAQAPKGQARGEETAAHDQNTWQGAEVRLRDGEVIVRSGSLKAFGRRDQIDPTTFRALNQRRLVIADVEVEKSERGWKIKKVSPPRA